MENASTNWQDSLDIRLINRLHRPLSQPGMMRRSMDQNIINRCDRFLNRLPLLSQQMQRWGNTSIFTTDYVPIVYPEPISTIKQQELNNLASQQSSLPLIQRKIDSATSNLSNDITSSLTLQNQISKASTSSTEIPVVSPQIISKELVNKSATSFYQKPEFPNNSYQIQPDNKDESVNPINHGNYERNQVPIFSTEIPVVSPQIISEELVNKLETPLYRESESPNNSYQIQPDNKDESVNPINYGNYERNQVSIFSTENPLVSSQIISENTLLKKTANSLQKPFPTIEIKQQNFDPSSPLIPIVTTQIVRDRNNFKQNNQNITSLPLVSIIPHTNSHINSQSLPLSLVKSSTPATHINPQTNLSNTNSSSPKIITNPVLTTKQTSIATAAKPTNQNSNIEIETIASKVERKIMRRLVIESERRGRIR